MDDGKDIRQQPIDKKKQCWNGQWEMVNKGLVVLSSVVSDL